MKEILGFLALCGFLAALATWQIDSRKRHWSDPRVALVAALPLPVIFTALCLFVLVRAALAPASACGGGACDMAMTFALIGFFWAAVGYGIGLGTATLLLRRLRR